MHGTNRYSKRIDRSIDLSTTTELNQDEQPGISQSQAAEMLNVSTPTVKRAIQVRDHGVPELQQAVEQGEVPVSAAVNSANLRYFRMEQGEWLTLPWHVP
jgi:hypothetical protein